MTAGRQRPRPSTAAGRGAAAEDGLKDVSAERAPAVEGRLLRRDELGREQRRAMVALMNRSFLGVTAEIFRRDLEAKDYAVLLERRCGDPAKSTPELCGFTTFSLTRRRHQGEELWVLCSGDTIVDPSAWGSFALASTWIGSVRQLREERGGERMVWLLICSGPRTYRFLPVFFRRFYPRHDEPTPPKTQALLDDLTLQQYGDAYDPGTGVVRLPNPQPLRPHLVQQREGADAHVQYFLQRNPGHAEGDELACLTELDDANLNAAGRRMVRAGQRGRRR